MSPEHRTLHTNTAGPEALALRQARRCATPSASSTHLARSIFLQFAGAMEWDAHTHQCSASLTADNVDFAVEAGGAFADNQNIQRLCARDFASSDAAPIVLHLEDEFVAFPSQVNTRLSSLCLPDDVGEGLLENAKHRSGP